MGRRNSIRFRITALAAASVAAVLVAGSAGLVLAQRASLTANIDAFLAQRADDITALVTATADLPDQLASFPSEGFAQLVGRDGRVLVSTPNLADSTALPIDVAAGTEDVLQTVNGLEVDDDAFRVLSRGIEGLGVLHVGTTYDVVAESVAALVGGLGLTIPILLVVLAALVWWLVGRTLRPVEAIRAQVAEIGAGQLDRRVPRPETDDEIDRLAATMNQMLARLESSVEQQRRFVADASHELRTPLTRLLTTLDVDLGRSDSPNRAEALESLRGEVIELQRLVDDLLYLARADEGRLVRSTRAVDLDEVVMREAQRIRADHRIDVDLSAVSGAQVGGDPGQLTRAVRNLLDNAQRHAQTRITVAVREEDSQAVLVVSDDGAGVPAEYAGQIFERFGRSDAARTAATGGAGLGLAITREIAERHGGTLTLQAAGGPGAAFELRLPLNQ